MTQKLIVSATSRGVVTMSISRPEKSNALDGETLALLFAACERVEKEASARVIVLRGAGKDFCSGADVGGELSAPDSPNTDRQFSIDRVCSRLNALPKPTIAVVAGSLHRRRIGACRVLRCCVGNSRHLLRYS
jgi:enoyl-CoA hydratase/carnithine racemase